MLSHLQAELCIHNKDEAAALIWKIPQSTCRNDVTGVGGLKIEKQLDDWKDRLSKMR